MKSKEFWYVIYTRSKHEKRLAEMLEEAGYTVYLPLIKKVSRWKDRKMPIDTPLFNSYVFIQGVCDKTLMRDFNGFVNFLEYNKKPAIVRQHEIDTLKTIIKHGYDVSESTDSSMLKTGNTVMVIGGPLKGMRGQLVSVDDADWFMINFEDIGNVLQVKIPPRSLRKLE